MLLEWEKESRGEYGDEIMYVGSFEVDSPGLFNNNWAMSDNSLRACRSRDQT